MCKFVLILFFMFLSSFSYDVVASTIEINGNLVEEVKLHRYLDYTFFDGNKDNQYRDVSKQDFKKMDSPHLGFVDKNFWGRFTLKINGNLSEHLIISFQSKSIAEIELFKLDSDNRLQLVSQGGELLGRKVRGHDRNLTLHWHVEKSDKSITYYMRVKTYDVMDIETVLWSEKDYSNFKGLDNFFTGMFYGIFFVIIILCIYYYLITKEQRVIWYIAFFMAITFLLAEVDGIPSCLFSLSFVGGWGKIIPINMALTIILGIKATILYLRASKTVYSKIGNWLMLFVGITSVFSLTPLWVYAHSFGHLMLVLAVLFVTYLSWIKYVQGVQFAGFSLVSWIFMGVFAITYLAILNGAFEGSLLLAYWLKVGVVGGMITIFSSFVMMINVYRAEAERVSKMNSLGTMISGIAHEVNNPLTIVCGNVEIIKMKLNKLNINDTGMKKSILAQENALKRIGNIVQEIKGLTDLTLLTLENISVHKCMQVAIGSLQNILNQQKISVTLNLNADKELVSATKSKMYYVFEQVLLNAIEAVLLNENVGSLKEITISTHNIDNKVTIIYKDSGVGMKEEDIKKSLDYFFTTKSPSKGGKVQGLGLSTSFSIVHAFGGDIHIESKVNRGTSVIIIIPLSTINTRSTSWV